MYVYLDDMKAYLNIREGDDNKDVLLAEMLGTAQNHVDEWCHRTFEPYTQVRYYDRTSVDLMIRDETEHDVILYSMPCLYLDEDIVSVATLTNGDGTVVSPSNYRLWPRNENPKSQIRLINGINWAFASIDAEIAVDGTWGYAPEPPENIKMAVKLLVARWFRLRNANWIDEIGTIPSSQDNDSQWANAYTRAMPRDVMDLLAPYKKQAR